MLKEMNTNLRRVLAPYTKRKLWVALSSDMKKVEASGTSPKSVLTKAHKAGVEEPVIMRALPNYSGFISSH